MPFNSMPITALSPPLHDPLPKLVQAISVMNVRALDRCLEIASTPYLTRKLRASTCSGLAERILTGFSDVRAVL